MARRQAEVATRAAADFEAAGDPGMAAMLRGHAEHLTHAATLPVVRLSCTAPRWLRPTWKAQT